MKKQLTPTQQLNRRFLSSLLIISLIIGLTHLLVNLMLDVYQDTGGMITSSQRVAMDTFLLLLVSTPLLWFLVLRRLVVEINRERERVVEQSKMNKELRSALDSHALVSITDTRGRILYANNKFCQISGYTLEELVGQDHRIINSGHHSKNYIKNMWDTIARGQVWEGEFCNQCKDGSLYWVDNTITPLLDEAGNPRQYISIRRDITLQKQAEAKLTALNRAIEASSEMIFITDAEGFIQYANPAFYRLTGWTEPELANRLASVLDSPNADIQTLAAMHKALGNRKNWSGRLLARRHGTAPFRSAGQTPLPDALEYWAEVSITPILDENGMLYGYVQIQRDIDAQVAHESLMQMENADTAARLAIAESLQQNCPLAERFTNVLNILFKLKNFALQRKGGVFLRAADKDYLEMSVLLGEFSEEFIAKEKKIVIGDCLCGRAAASGELLVSDDCFCDPRHEHTFANMQAHGHYIVPIAAAGDVLGVLFLYTDTYPSRNETRLAMLRQLGAMMALAILQEQAKTSLETARDMAMQTALAKSEFLANMSHEIRTPMNGVLGMLDLLRDTDMTRTQWDLVDTAYDSADALLDILNDILDFSKLEAGKIKVEQVDFNLSALVEDVCALLSGRAFVKSLELNCCLPTDMPPYWKGDPTRIRQVLINLIGNAVKFTEQGEVSVTVTCTKSIEGTAVFRFEVRDTGVGISAEVQSRLFQPFSQADSATARRYGGTGLGLSISKNLAELMGGSIALDSTPELGSCFWFTLPLSMSESEETTAPSINFADKRVLVVDDNATNRTILLHYLKHWGLAVEQVANGRAALVELEEAHKQGTPYDLAVLDMHMPEMDGLTLARIIAETPALAVMPRILLSSGRLASDDERQSLGLAQSLLKPIRQSQLFDAIANTFYASMPPSVKNEKHEIELPSYHGKQVLVVEDNKVNQKVILGMLAKFQLTPDIAEDGQFALIKMTEKPYDLVLMDCQMPVLDGYEATRELRRREMAQGLPHQTVVALTAHAVDGERDKCLSAGMDDYLAKPITRERLAEMLEQWLGSKCPVTDPFPSGEKAEAKAAPIWNKAAALTGVDSDEDLLADMIDLFLDEAPRQLTEICTALSEGDLTALANAAHTIKGSVAYFCAGTVRDCAERLEQAARCGEPADYQHMTDQLAAIFTQLMETLRQSRINKAKET